MLIVNQIDKSFGKKRAIADLSLRLEEGHIFGMLGTNGAGKSTLEFTHFLTVNVHLTPINKG